jgi:hypothetical protein
MHPEFIPSVKTARYLAVGHYTTVADLMWLETIQMIGDNIGNGRYIAFMHTFIDHITGLHPYFARPYEMILMLTPTISQHDTPTQKKDTENVIRNAITIGEKGMQTLCEGGHEKLKKIHNIPVNQSPWKIQELRNPCVNGVIPYYLGILYSEIGESEKSSDAYKIASMQDDAPASSAFLSILTRAGE